MGFEGANVLFDTLVHPLMMGLEEHLIGMFRDDFEFRDGATPSHLGPAEHADVLVAERVVAAPVSEPAAKQILAWSIDAEKELRKIPFFVRAKARRNTEAYANERGIVRIDVETLYDAKAHYGR
jgi:light-independent protochlorophyllide reductase subunit B